MSVYVIAQIEINDRDEYGTYEGGFLPIFAQYEGELLSVDEQPRVLEGEWGFTRSVLIRFPSEEEARRWYESPDYQKLAQHRRAAARSNIILVNGFPPGTFDA